MFILSSSSRVAAFDQMECILHLSESSQNYSHSSRGSGEGDQGTKREQRVEEYGSAGVEMASELQAWP